MESAITPAEKATVKLLISGSDHLVFSNTSAYQRNEKPRGGKIMNFFSLTETPATMNSGALSTTMTAA